MNEKQNPDMERDLLALGKELAAREEAAEKEWYKTHRRMGRDGGPTEQIKEIREEGKRRFGEILSKYRNPEKDERDSHE